MVSFEMKGRSNRKPIAYVSFTTFLTVLNRLKGTRVGDTLTRERCAVRNKSSWEQVCHSFRALQLLDEDDRLTTTLIKLNGKNCKSELLKLLQRQYAEIFDLDLNRIGPGKLEQALNANYGVTRATKKRARSFLLGALRYCEVQLSPELSRMTRHRVQKKRRFQTFAPSPGEGTFLSHTAHGMTLTITVDPGSWPGIEAFEDEIINRLFGELRTFKTRTTKRRQPHLTSVKPSGTA